MSEKAQIKHLETLKEISSKLKTQNNRLCSYPFFIVYDRFYIPVAEGTCPITTNHDDDGGKAVYIHSDLDGQEFDSKEDLMKYARDNEYEDIDEDDIESFDVQYMDRFVSMFLTEDAAKDFLEYYGHHLSAPYIYGDSFYDNEEMRVVCESIASLTPEIPPHKNGVGY
jgi:hypothetical protein